jgi:glucokinase
VSTARSVGIDVGGTSVKAVVADDRGGVIAELRRATPSPDPTGAGVVEMVASMLAELEDASRLPLGVVVPGVVDEDMGLAVYSANLGWNSIPLAAMLQERLGRDLAFGHDVRAGALAEARWGAASGSKGVLAFVPIGTGIAAAILVDGRPLVSGGWAGEIGQSVINGGPFAGSRVEDIASAASTARRAGLPDARTVAEHVRRGDEQATAVWQGTVAVLADALVSMTSVVAPQTIVLGGGLAMAGDTLVVPLERALDERLGALRRPRIRVAELGDRAAALGAAILARGPA